MYSFSYLEPVFCSMSSSNCCFLTCIQISQEAGQVVWYSHLFQNFPQFIDFAVILEPLKIKSATVSTVSPCICHEVMGPDAMVLVFWMYWEAGNVEWLRRVFSLGSRERVMLWTLLLKHSRTVWSLPCPPPHHVLCLPFACGRLQSKNKFNQRSEKCGSKGKQSEETKW